MQNYILGINAYHGDSSACLLKNGKLVFAIEEERLCRIKHWAGFPQLSITACLDAAGIKISDVNDIAINTDPKANISKKIIYTIMNNPNPLFIIDRLRNRKARQNIKVEFEKHFHDFSENNHIHFVEHHLCHLSSAYHVSPYKESAILSVDGFGDFSSTVLGYGEDASIRIIDKVHFPHSLGIFYQAITQYLGFPNYGDEYKVMGLAPYGKEKYVEHMSQLVNLKDNGLFSLDLSYFRHSKEGVKYKWDNGKPVITDVYSDKLESLLGDKRSKNDKLSQKHMDIARSAQVMFERAFLNLLNRLKQETGSSNLALAGGCAMNSVANGKVKNNTGFKNVYIQAAAGDAGGAIGAAYMVWHKAQNNSERFHMSNAYVGPAYNSDIEALVNNLKELRREDLNIKLFENFDDLAEYTAIKISEKKVIGWYQGEMEWGPRALGNRSILGDPRNPEMKEILNVKIKRREEFRPFAPSILREETCKWFEVDDDVPFMMKVYQIKPEQREKIPAVTHVDGSGRLQTVTNEINSRYYILISKFFKLTGVPILLNTSFNENEPIVCKPQEALETFLRTKMDCLILGDWLIERT